MAAGTIAAGLLLTGCADTTTGVAVPPSSVASIETTRSNAEISAYVRADMQKQFNEDPEFAPYGLLVTELLVVRSTGNDYTGVAKVVTAKGTQRDIPIRVTADAKDFVWQTAVPGLFDFLAYE